MSYILASRYSADTTKVIASKGVREGNIPSTFDLCTYMRSMCKLSDTCIYVYMCSAQDSLAPVAKEYITYDYEYITKRGELHD